MVFGLSSSESRKAGLTSDHLPSAEKIAQKHKSGSQETKKERDGLNPNFLDSWFPDWICFLY
jgi:hypothetical protein